MKCDIYQKLFTEWLDGTLPGDMREPLDTHLRECHFCRAALDAAKLLSTSISSLLVRTSQQLVLRPGVKDEVINALEEAPGGTSFEVMMQLFEKLTFREKVRKVIEGLKQPPESGEYKWAKLQMTRLWSWVSAVVVPVVVLLLMAFFAGLTPDRHRAISVTIMEPPPEEKLEELEVIEEEFIEPPEPLDMEFNELANNPHDVMMEDAEINPPDDFAPQPAKFDSVSIVRSPVTMRGIYGSRSPGSRGRARGLYGGNNATEGAVLRALRWLKKYQEEDGSWVAESGHEGRKVIVPGGEHYGNTGVPAAMTALGLLTFLAHGETPGSPEFGKTVERAIKWLIANQPEDGFFPTPRNDLGYTHPICAYALCEGYSMTKIPELGEAAGKAIKVILEKQNPQGGWTYLGGRWNASRTDCSMTAWSVQALKAADVAGIHRDAARGALKKARAILSKVMFVSGANYFGYATAGPGNLRSHSGSLCGAGALGMQLAGGASDVETLKGIEFLKTNASCNWSDPWGRSPVYDWYYVTQAMFHAGGETWKLWNKQFSPALVTNQTVVKGGGVNGKDIGYWNPVAAKEYCQNYTYNTTLCALMLQVYYRYLPTYKTPDALEAEAVAAEGEAEQQKVIDAEDIVVEIINNG